MMWWVRVSVSKPDSFELIPETHVGLGVTQRPGRVGLFLDLLGQQWQGNKPHWSSHGKALRGWEDLTVLTNVLYKLGSTLFPFWSSALSSDRDVEPGARAYRDSGKGDTHLPTHGSFSSCSSEPFH